MAGGAAVSRNQYPAGNETAESASGMAVDYENKRLSLSPAAESLTFPLVLPDILALVSISEGKADIECISGDLNGWEITVKGE